MTTVHTYPAGDLIGHVTNGDDCPCGPTTEAVFREDGSNGYVIVHHSLDGRELREVTELVRRRGFDKPCVRCAFIPTPDGKCICREVTE